MCAGAYFPGSRGAPRADLWLVLTGKSQFSPIARLVMMGILWLLAFLYVMVMIYVWAVMARFENTVGRTVFNSIVMAIANIKSTVMMICWDVSLITVTAVCVGFFPQAAAVLLLFGFPSLFILNAVRLRPILDQCGQKQIKRIGSIFGSYPPLLHRSHFLYSLQSAHFLIPAPSHCAQRSRPLPWEGDHTS